MNKIEILFNSRALKRGGLSLYSKDDAMKFVEECEKENLQILGIDGFYITENTTEPSIENSIDFSLFSGSKNNNSFIKAKAFLIDKDEKLFFEIVY